jgi:hypothetical protein
LIDAKNPKNGNYFVSIMNEFKNNDISSKEIKDILENITDNNVKKFITTKICGDDGSKLMKTFRQNINTLFDDILKEAEEIKKQKKPVTP